LLFEGGLEQRLKLLMVPTVQALRQGWSSLAELKLTLGKPPTEAASIDCHTLPDRLPIIGRAPAHALDVASKHNPHSSHVVQECTAGNHLTFFSVLDKNTPEGGHIQPMDATFEAGCILRQF
jgi:hypothetical protein